MEDGHTRFIFVLIINRLIPHVDYRVIFHTLNCDRYFIWKFKTFTVGNFIKKMNVSTRRKITLHKSRGMFKNNILMNNNKQRLTAAILRNFNQLHQLFDCKTDAETKDASLGAAISYNNYYLKHSIWLFLLCNSFCVSIFNFIN